MSIIKLAVQSLMVFTAIAIPHAVAESSGWYTEAEHYRVDKPIGDNGDIDLISLGLIYRLGEESSAPTLVPMVAPVVSPVAMTMHIEFDQNQNTIKPEYADDLRKIANFLKANPSTTATIEGYTGNLQTTSELAMETSRRGAESVVNYLVNNLGVTRSRLFAEGFGRGRRSAYNTNQEEQQENRKINIVINYTK